MDEIGILMLNNAVFWPCRQLMFNKVVSKHTHSLSVSLLCLCVRVCVRVYEGQAVADSF